MVKIKEEGILPQYEITCCNCKSKLTFDKLDEQLEYSPDVPFYGQCTDWFIVCAKCNTKVPTRSLTEIKYYEWRKEIE